MLITASSIALIYALIKIPEWGWTGDRTLALAGVAAALLAAFVALEARIANPIMPLRVLGLRSLVTANLVRGFLVTGAYSTFFLGALYFEHVRGMSPVQIGLAFMAMSVSLAAMSSGLSAPVWSSASAPSGPWSWVSPDRSLGLLLFSQIGQSTPYFPTIFVSLALLGLGFGAANPPLMMIAMEDVPAKDAGLASGTIQVSIQLSAAIGLAALGTIATDRTNALRVGGRERHPGAQRRLPPRLPDRRRRCSRRDPDRDLRPAHAERGADRGRDRGGRPVGIEAEAAETPSGWPLRWALGRSAMITVRRGENPRK